MSGLRDFRTDSGRANAAIMRRSFYEQEAAHCACVLVEGNGDINAYIFLLDDARTYLVSCDGKKEVLAVLEYMADKRFKGHIAIVDADLDRLLNKPIKKGNVVMTDRHDMETMALGTDAMNKLVRELLPPESSVRLGVFADQILTRTLNFAKWLGYLRYLAHKGTLEISFARLAVESYRDRNQVRGNITRAMDFLQDVTRLPELIAFVLDCSKDDNRVSRLVAKLEKLDEKKWDLLELCRGHDVMEIMPYVIADELQKLGRTDGQVAIAMRDKFDSRERLEQKLRDCFGFDHFQTTAMYRQMRQWERDNSPYMVFETRVNGIESINL